MTGGTTSGGRGGSQAGGSTGSGGTLSGGTSGAAGSSTGGAGGASCSNCPSGTVCLCCSGNTDCLCTIECDSDDACGNSDVIDPSYDHCNGRSSGQDICAAEGHCD
jgi:hypothetical protein